MPGTKLQGAVEIGSFQGRQGDWGGGNWFIFLQDCLPNAGWQMFFHSCMALPTPMHLIIFHKLLTPFLKKENQPNKTRQLHGHSCACAWVDGYCCLRIDAHKFSYWITSCIFSDLFSKLSQVFQVLILYLPFLLSFANVISTFTFPFTKSLKKISITSGIRTG